jgi:hypothetical protein
MIIYYMTNNKFSDVFLGPPWTGKCNTWPGVSSNQDGSTISNYFKFPLPAIDPPVSPSLAGQFRGPGGFVTGGKRRSKKRNSKKCKKRRKSKKRRFTKKR